MMTARMAPEYVVVGHCALDVQPDGSFLPGGTVLYSALTAARMGMRAAILTAGDPAALTAALAPFDGCVRASISCRRRDDRSSRISRRRRDGGRRSTAGPGRSCRMPYQRRGDDATILHLGPIANELPPDAWADALGTTDARTDARDAARVAAPLGHAPLPVRHEPSRCPIACSTAWAQWSFRSRNAMWRRRPCAAWRCTGSARSPMARTAWTFCGATTTTHVPTFPVAVRDETGAGDVFAAAWAVQIARGDSPEAAARVGLRGGLTQHHRARPARHPDRAADCRATRDEHRPGAVQ